MGVVRIFRGSVVNDPSLKVVWILLNNYICIDRAKNIIQCLSETLRGRMLYANGKPQTIEGKKIKWFCKKYAMFWLQNLMKILKISNQKLWGRFMASKNSDWTLLCQYTMFYLAKFGPRCNESRDFFTSWISSCQKEWFEWQSNNVQTRKQCYG